jgi:(p)ppGpp synthase/HD superfamily hydrolase
MNDVRLLSKAWHVAAVRHIDQRRKGQRAEPYLNHLAEVADLVAEATDGADAKLVAAAILHDTVEDTDLSAVELERLFGADVARLVLEVTDDKALPKAERKRLQVANAAKKSARAKILKLADKTSNLRSIADSPPADWSRERQRDYLDWARAVVDGLRATNAWLESEFDKAAGRLEERLGG